MSKIYDSLDDGLCDFIAKQAMFFVATAPRDGGHINISPKGLDSFRVLGPKRVAYLDLTGSGIETIAHLRENGRITIMFCALSGPAKILRLYGQGAVRELGSEEFERLSGQFDFSPGTRSIIEVALDRIADACGYGVPLYEYRGERDQLTRWAERKGDEGLSAYRADRNAASIDGLKGYTGA